MESASGTGRAEVGDRVPALLDSAIRSGADVFTAAALGARAVLLGRPFAWGLGVAGEAGVWQVVSDVLAEFVLTLGLTGHTAVGELSPDALRRVPCAFGTGSAG